MKTVFIVTDRTVFINGREYLKIDLKFVLINEGYEIYAKDPLVKINNWVRFNNAYIDNEGVQTPFASIADFTVFVNELIASSDTGLEVPWNQVTSKPTVIAAGATQEAAAAELGITATGLSIIQAATTLAILQALGGSDAGIDMLTAPDEDAQAANLGLQALAFLSTVSTDQIEDASVTAAKILAGTITGDKLANGTVTLDKLAANSVDGSKIADGSISNTEISSTANIDLSKLANVAAGTAGLVAGSIQATFQALATRIAALETP